MLASGQTDAACSNNMVNAFGPSTVLNNNISPNSQQQITANMISSTNSTSSNESITNLPNSSNNAGNLNLANTNQLKANSNSSTSNQPAGSNNGGNQATGSNNGNNQQTPSAAIQTGNTLLANHELNKAKNLNNDHMPIFRCPKRPNKGTEGRPIALKANHFQITMPRGFLYHYDISISPDKCPRKINREIIETMVLAYSKVFPRKPVFDGRKNMYTKEELMIGRDRIELEVTLPGEGKDRLFRIAIKYIGQVNLDLLENALEGESRTIPIDAIQALDVIMRHLPSMAYTPVGRSFFSTPDGYYHPLGGGREVSL